MLQVNILMFLSLLIASFAGQIAIEDKIWILMLEYEQGDFWKLSPETGERTFLFSFEPQLGQILDFVVDPEFKAIYILEGTGCCGGITAGESRLSRLDLNTGITEIVFIQRNLFAIEYVNNFNDILVSFYEPVLESITIAARDGLIEYCLLDLQTQTCTKVERNSFAQIDPDLLNIIPDIVEDDFDPFVQFYPISFSPNGEYILFLHGYEHVVIEYISGEIIARLPNSFDPQWSDANDLIYLYFDELGNYPGEIRKYNSELDENISLIEFEERIRIIILPEVSS